VCSEDLLRLLGLPAGCPVRDFTGRPLHNPIRWRTGKEVTHSGVREVRCSGIRQELSIRVEERHLPGGFATLTGPNPQCRTHQDAPARAPL
jgi:hypothetical protein